MLPLDEINDRLIVWIIGLAMLVLAFAQPAHSQVGNSPHGNLGTAHSHDGAVGRMYQGWQRPDHRRTNKFNSSETDRYWSCCNEKDCHAVQTRMVSGRWQYLSTVLGRWMEVPDAILETNYPDAELTPDGRPHACERPDGELWCFTPGDPEL